MTKDRFQNIRDLFLQAVALPANERSAMTRRLEVDAELAAVLLRLLEIDSMPKDRARRALALIDCSELAPPTKTGALACTHSADPTNLAPVDTPGRVN